VFWFWFLSFCFPSLFVCESCGFPPQQFSNGAVTIIDVKGDQFMVNGQRLKVYCEPDVVPLHHVDVFTMEEEPERPA
jgi:hypothetical protein